MSKYDIDPHEVRMKSGQLHMAVDEMLSDDDLRAVHVLAERVAKVAKIMEKRGMPRPVIVSQLCGVVIGTVLHEEMPN